MKFKALVASALFAVAMAPAFASSVITIDQAGNGSFSSTPAKGTFTDVYKFSLPDSFDTITGSITTKMNTTAKDVDFTSITLSNGTSTYSYVQKRDDSSTAGEYWTLASVKLVGGVATPYTLTLTGTTTGKALYTGEFSVVAAVPEPETYAMMLAGLGLVGFVARRRKAAQAA